MIDFCCILWTLGGAFGALSKSLFPLYYRVKQENTLKISMYEKCDVSLVFGDGQLHLEEIGLPEGFPKPSESPSFAPFSIHSSSYFASIFTYFCIHFLDSREPILAI